MAELVAAEDGEDPNNALLSLTTHFAQVQFRLKQIIAAPQEDRNDMLMRLEEFAFNSCPDVRTKQQSSDFLEQMSHQDYEERLRRQKEKQQQLIRQLQQQLQELEEYARDSQRRASELQSQFDPVLAEKQKVLIAELKSKLNMQFDDVDGLSLEELRSEVDTAVAQVRRPIRSKEEQIKHLTTQVADLERFVHFLKEEGQPTLDPLPESQDMTDSALQGNRPQNAKKKDKRVINPVVLSVADKALAMVCCPLAPADFGQTGDSEDLELDGNMSQKRYEEMVNRVGKRGQAASRILSFGTLSWIADSFFRLVWGKLQNEEPPSYSEHLQQLQRSVNRLITLLAAQANNSTEDDAESAALRPSAELTAVARVELATALIDLFHHGLSAPRTGSGLVPIWHGLGCAFPPAQLTNTPSSRTHVWQVFEYFYALKLGDQYNSTPARTLSTAFQVDLSGGIAVTPKQMLFDDILKIQSSHEPHKKSPDCKFRSLVCAGLNRRQLSAWCQMVARSQAVVEQFYLPWSFVAQRGFAEAVGCLERLSELEFNLPTDFPVRQLSSIKEVFGDPF